MNLWPTPPMAHSLEFIESVAAKDDTTVTFTLKYPFEALLKGRLSVVRVFPAASTEDGSQDHAHRFRPVEVRHQRR